MHLCKKESNLHLNLNSAVFVRLSAELKKSYLSVCDSIMLVITNDIFAFEYLIGNSNSKVRQMMGKDEKERERRENEKRNQGGTASKGIPCLIVLAMVHWSWVASGHLALTHRASRRDTQNTHLDEGE